MSADPWVVSDPDLPGRDDGQYDVRPCPSTVLGHRCYLEAGHDSDHEDDTIYWGDPVPGPKRVEPGNPFSPLVLAVNGYSVNLERDSE